MCKRDANKPNPSRCLRCDKTKKGCSLHGAKESATKGKGGRSAPLPPKQSVAVPSDPVTPRKRKFAAGSPEGSKPLPPPGRPDPATRRFPPRAPRPVGDPLPLSANTAPPSPPAAAAASSSQALILPPPGPPRSPVLSSPPPSLPSLPSVLPTHPLRPSVSTPALYLEYENRLLREQLSASQEDLRLAREQISRERVRSDRQFGIFKEFFDRFQGGNGSSRS